MQDFLFVDVNAVLETISDRKKAERCNQVFSQYSKLYLSPTSVHIIYYFSKKLGIPNIKIQELIKDFTVLDFTHQTYQKSLQICTDNDMEDALQIASAIDNKIPNAFTLDQKMIKNYQNLINFV